MSWDQSRWGVSRCCVRGSSPCPRCALWARAAGWGILPPLPPLAAARVKRVRPFRDSPFLSLSSVRFSRGKCALWGFFPLLLRILSLPVLPRNHGRPFWRQPPRWLDPPPLPRTPVSRTRDAHARRTRTWRRRRRQIAATGSLRCYLPLPSMSCQAAPPSAVRPSSCRRRCRLPASWFLGRWVGFRPLPPSPVRPPPVCPEPLWGLLGFRPPWSPRPPREGGGG